MGLARRLAPAWAAAAIVSPSLAWIALDRRVWPWDQAWFGFQTVALWEALRSDPLRWTAAMLHAAPTKPPAVAWVGQLFVPLGMTLGSVDAGLLLSVIVTHLVALAVLFRALLALAGGRTAIAAAGTLLVGSAPIFIGLSTQYLAEAAQVLAVSWFVLLMARAPRWPRSRLFAHLVAATAFAMLAKSSSPLYCTVPGLVALFQGVRPRRTDETAARSPRPATWALWCVALLAAAGAAAWYALNWSTALQHVTTAAFGPVAEFYGHRATVWHALSEWSRASVRVSFLDPVAFLAGALVLAGLGSRARRGRRSANGHADVCALAASAQIALAILAFSFSPNRDPRYVAPLLPLAAVVFAWALLQVGRTVVDVAAAGVLALQLVLVQTYVLGLRPNARGLLWVEVGIHPSLSVVHHDGAQAADLAAIVERTCGRGGFGAYDFVGADLVYLSGHSLTYAAAKERLAGRAGACRYDSLGFGTLEFARRLLNANAYVYWIAADPAIHPVPAPHAFLNQTAPVVFRQLRRRGTLQQEPWNGPPGILLYRFVSR